MATIITVSPSGEVRIVVGGSGEPCPTSDLVTKADLDAAVATLQAGQGHTDSLIAALAARVEAVYKAVRQPGKIVVSYGAPQPETQE